jgi:uncharacterized protein (TIRG00374 family)
MKRRAAKSLVFLAQVLAAALVFGWIFRQPGLLAGMRETLGRCDPWWLVLALLCAGLSIVAHVWRWWWCLKLLDVPVRWTKLFGVFLAGSFLGTFMIGGIGGDTARILLLARSYPGKFPRLTISVIADRLFGLVALGIPAILFTFPARETLSGSIIGKGAVHFLGGYLVFSFLLFLFSFGSGWERARRCLPRWLPARDWFLGVSDAFRALRPDAKGLLAATVSSVGMLALHFSTFWCVARSFTGAVGFFDFCAIMPVVEAATTVPATPSGIGIREELFRDQLFLLNGLDAATAVWISLAGFSCGLAWHLVGGAVAMFFTPRLLLAPHEPATTGEPTTVP